MLGAYEIGFQTKDKTVLCLGVTLEQAAPPSCARENEVDTRREGAWRNADEGSEPDIHARHHSASGFCWISLSQCSVIYSVMHDDRLRN